MKKCLDHIKNKIIQFLPRINSTEEDHLELRVRISSVGLPLLRSFETIWKIVTAQSWKFVHIVKTKTFLISKPIQFSVLFSLISGGLIIFDLLSFSDKLYSLGTYLKLMLKDWLKLLLAIDSSLNRISFNCCIIKYHIYLISQ